MLTFLGLLVLYVALGLAIVMLSVKVLPWISQALPGGRGAVTDSSLTWAWYGVSMDQSATTWLRRPRCG